MNELGNIALITLFPVALFGAVASFLGGSRRLEGFVRAGERSLAAAFFLVSLSVLSLAGLFLSDAFQNAYVANHSNAALPFFYKITALWAGQEGSLLFWNWLLAGFGVAVLLSNRSRNRDLLPFVVSVLLFSVFFFTALNLFASNPFRTLLIEHGGTTHLFRPEDGQGLNPLLQHPAMVIHPPVLYLGYVGFVVPFAFALAALWIRSPGNRWLLAARRSALFAWLFLSAGILLGARWAYVELGWGGYWAWDPVENASLMPWLTGTAFIHSLMIQEKRGMLKVWNVTLIAVTYLLCVFGTFLTRSGIVSSVHAFAQSSVGAYFAAFLALGILVSFALIWSRRDYLRSEGALDSVLSRESSFFFNNLVFLVSCFAVLWGTLFPVLSEAVRGEKISVGPPYFNRINVPIGLFLLFLTGFAPLLAWRRTSWAGLKRSLAGPIAFALLSGVLLFLLAVRAKYALICFGLSAFVAATITMEFARGARARMTRLGEKWPQALLRLPLRNPRRYGGYIVHLGVVLVFVGIAGSSYNRTAAEELPAGGEMTLGDYTLRVEKLEEGETPNYRFARAAVGLYRDGGLLGTYFPERRFYRASEQPSTEVKIRSGFKEDLYLVYASTGEKGGAIIQVYRNPLVRWVWIGGIVLVFGGLICLFPARKGDPS